MENLDSAPQETHSSKRLLIVLGLLVGTGLAAFYLLGGSQLLKGMLRAEDEADREMGKIGRYVSVKPDGDCADAEGCAWPLNAEGETAFKVSEPTPAFGGVMFSSEKDGETNFGEWIVIDAELEDVTTEDGLTVTLEDSSAIINTTLARATIDWGDGIMDETEDMDAEGLTFEHTYTSAGTYKVNYQLEDTEGRTDTFFITATAEAETETTDEPAAPLFTDLSCTGSVDAHGTKSLAFSYTAADGINIDNYRFALDVLDDDALGAPPMTSLQASGASYAISDTLAPGTHTLIAAIWTSEVFPVDGASTRCPLTIEESDPEPVEVTATCSANYTTSDNRLAYAITHDVEVADTSQFRIRAHFTAPDGTITNLEDHTMRESGGAFAETIDPALSPGEYTVEFIVSMISSSTEVVRNTCNFTVEEPTPEPEPIDHSFDVTGDCEATATVALDDPNNVTTITSTFEHNANPANLADYEVKYDIDGALLIEIAGLSGTGEDVVLSTPNTDPSLDLELDEGEHNLDISAYYDGDLIDSTSCDFQVPVAIEATSCDTTTTRDTAIITLNHNIAVDGRSVMTTFTDSDGNASRMASQRLSGPGRTYNYTLTSPTGSYTANIVVQNGDIEVGRASTTCSFSGSASTSTLHASVLSAFVADYDADRDLPNFIVAPAGSTVYFKANNRPGSGAVHIRPLVTGEFAGGSPIAILDILGTATYPLVEPADGTAGEEEPPKVIIGTTVDGPPVVRLTEVAPLAAVCSTSLNTVTTGQTFTFTGKDSTGSINKAVIDFGDGRSKDILAADIAKLQLDHEHNYTSAGTKTIKLTLTDTSGATATCSKDITVNAPAAGGTSGGGSGTPQPVCSDGKDNDGDGYIDFGPDSGCDGPSDTDEANLLPRTDTQCSDGKDNDGDGRIDYPADFGCENANSDNNEYNSTQENVIAGSTLLNDKCHDKTNPVKFDDIQKSWYAYDVVKSESSVEYDGVDKELRGEAIFIGYESEDDEDERVFLKDRAINRVEAQKIVQVAVCLSDYLEEDEIDLDNLDNDFSDVPKDAWFTHFVNIGVEAGIIDDDNDEYHPYKDVTRAEFMALLVRAYSIVTDTKLLTFDEKKNPFIDVEEDDWFADIAYSAYKWGFSEGFTDSRGNQRLSPNRALTRGDAAVWLHNFFAILHDRELGDL